MFLDLDKLQNFLALLELKKKMKAQFQSSYLKGDISLKGWAEKILL